MRFLRFRSRLDSNQTPKIVLVLEFFESFFAVAIEKRPLLVFLKKSFFVNKSRRMLLGLKRVAQFMQLLATWALPFGGPFPGALTVDVVLMMLPDRILRAVKLRAQWVGSENIVWFSHASKQVARKITKINAPITIHAKVVYNSSIVSSKNADLWHSEQKDVFEFQFKIYESNKKQIFVKCLIILWRILVPPIWVELKLRFVAAALIPNANCLHTYICLIKYIKSP